MTRDSSHCIDIAYIDRNELEPELIRRDEPKVEVYSLDHHIRSYEEVLSPWFDDGCIITNAERDIPQFLRKLLPYVIYEGELTNL